jgi:hypothetical protein
VVRYLGEGKPPAADLALIQRTVQVLDTASRMLLVEATPDQLAGLVRSLPHWRAARERSFTLVT